MAPLCHNDRRYFFGGFFGFRGGQGRFFPVDAHGRFAKTPFEVKVEGEKVKVKVKAKDGA